MNENFIPTDEDKKNFLEEDFAYEVELLCFSFTKLIEFKNADGRYPQSSSYFTDVSTGWVPPQYGHQTVDRNNVNMALETFLLHARNLVEFFYTKHKKYSTDVRALDFFENKGSWIGSRPNLTGSLTKIRERAGKELAHLTYKRISGTPPEKDWSTGETVEDLVKVINIFLDRLPPKYIGERLRNLPPRIAPYRSLLR